MAFNFLNKDGLTYFWNKIKARIGTATLTTTAQDLSGAVNELKSNKMDNNISKVISNTTSVNDFMTQIFNDLLSKGAASYVGNYVRNGHYSTVVVASFQLRTRGMLICIPQASNIDAIFVANYENGTVTTKQITSTNVS